VPYMATPFVGILYAVIARQDVRLCEYKSAAMPYNPFQVSQATTKVTSILARLEPKVDQRRSFKTSAPPELQFHVIVNNGLTVMCMCEASYPKRRAHPFLDDVRTHFLAPQIQNWGSWETAPVGHFESVFGRQLATLAEKHSNPDTDKISVVHKQLEEARHVFLEQIELLLERGEHIDILEDKTKNLANESVTFRQKARAMKMRFCMKNAKLIAVVVVLVLVVVFLLVWFACGVPDFKSCAALGKSAATPTTPIPPTPPTQVEPPRLPPVEAPRLPPAEVPRGP